MKAVFISDYDDFPEWEPRLKSLMPELEIADWRAVPDPESVRAAVVWKPPPGALKRYPRLQLIQALGMGVDYLFADPELPAVPIARLVDPDLIAQMSEYVCLATLHHHRRFGEYEALQRERRWQLLPPPDTSTCRVGIMGLGEIGTDAARKLAILGFPVYGWSRTPKAQPDVASFHGADGLAAFLAQSQILVCLLPLTRATRGIINAETLARLPRGAYVINAARGGHVVEADLLAAIDGGHIAGATLDVFDTEPLPPAHPFWNHPRIRITPHIAGLTRAATAAAQVVENLRRLHAGREILHRVDASREY